MLSWRRINEAPLSSFRLLVYGQWQLTLLRLSLITICAIKTPFPAHKPHIHLNMVQSHLKNTIICICAALLARHGATRHKVNYISNYIIADTQCRIPNWHDLQGQIYLFSWYRNVLLHTSENKILSPVPICVLVTKVQLGLCNFLFPVKFKSEYFKNQRKFRCFLGMSLISTTV